MKKSEKPGKHELEMTKLKMPKGFIESAYKTDSKEKINFHCSIYKEIYKDAKIIKLPQMYTVIYKRK